MATRKSGTTAKKKPAPKASTTVTTVRAASVSSSAASSRRGGNLINVLLAELVGTFVLTTVALMTASDMVPLYLGLAFAMLAMVVGGVSGSHFNPAVTFGLWAARRVRTVLVPFYWVCQFVGAMASLLVMSAVSGNKIALDFGHFGSFSWSIFFVELIGTAVFLFGFTTVINRVNGADGSSGYRAAGLGLSLLAGLLVATSFYTQVRQAAIADYQQKASTAQSSSKASPEIPHQVYVNGATLNPAVALVSTESTQSELNTGQASDSEKHYSRIGWEVILSTLIGAALGSNLALLVAYRFRS